MLSRILSLTESDPNHLDSMAIKALQRTQR